MKSIPKRLAFVAAVSSAMIACSPAYAQHGGHGGGHGGIGHSIGHGGGHGIGHSGGHSIGHGGGHGIGHGGIGHSFGHSIGHGIGHGVEHVGSHYGGHTGIGHVDYHAGHHGVGHHDLGHHSYYPHVDVHATPYYSGYGYSSGVVTPYYGYYGQSPSAIGSPGIVYAAPNASSYTVAKPAISVAAPSPAPSASADSADSNNFKVRAEEAFRNSNYGEAARLANHALVDAPEDGKLVLFFAQSLFAIGDYESAASAIHRAASLLAPEQWGYVVENYKQYYRGNGYVDQMARLNDFIKSNPESASARFVRGYQFGFLGQTEVAIGDLSRTLEIESRDQLAIELVKRFGGVSITDSAVSPPAPEAPVEPAQEQEAIEIDSPPPALGSLE